MVGKIGKAGAILIALGFVGLGFSMGMTAEQPDITIQTSEIDTEEGIVTATITAEDGEEQTQLTLKLLEDNQEIASEEFIMEQGELEKEVSMSYEAMLDPDSVYAITISDEEGEIDRTAITPY